MRAKAASLETAHNPHQTSAQVADQAVPVIEVIASGPARGGGIGQVLRFILEENEAIGLLRVVDTVDPRGPDHWVETLWRLPASLLQITGLRLANGRAPVLHVHMSGRLSTVRKTLVMGWAHVLGLKVALHYHEYGYADFFLSLPAPARAFVRMVLRRCAAHIVLGPAEKQRLPRLIGVDPARFHVIPNGAPAALVALPRPAPASRLDIVFVGALSDRKGVPELIAAAAGLAVDAPWRLVFCGPGDLEARAALAAQAGIAERCVFLGLQDNAAIQARLRESAIFALPSHAEGFAIALLEAMAAGCAIVATLVGEQRQALRHDDNALVVEPGNVIALREALTRLITDRDLRTRLGESARRDIETTFNTRVMLERVAAVLADVAAD